MDFRVLMLRVVRGVVWLLLGWLLVRGVADVLVPHPGVAAETQAPVAVPETPPTGDPEDRQAAGTFAALFAREYLTWAPEAPMDREERLKPYLAPGLDPQAGWVPGSGAAGQYADVTWPYRTESLGDSRWLVTVAARVWATGRTGAEAVAGETRAATAAGGTGAGTAAGGSGAEAAAGGGEAGAATAETWAAASRLIFLAVPVAGGADGFVVYDYPTIVPGPRPPRVEVPPLPGDEVEDAGGRVKALLTGFFRAYAAGGEGDVAYFLVPDLSLRGLEGALEFVEVRELSLRRLGDETWAYALVRFQDPVTGAHLDQRYTLRVVERDGRWYIAEMVQKGD